MGGGTVCGGVWVTKPRTSPSATGATSGKYYLVGHSQHSYSNYAVQTNRSGTYSLYC